MKTTDSIIAVFKDHDSADTAIKNLAAAGFSMANLSLVGRGYHSEEKVIGFYNAGDRIKFWGSRGAFWGGFWGLFFSGAVLSVPVAGQVIVLGGIAAVLASVVEGAIVLGGMSGLAAALYSLGVPRNSIIDYEVAIKADDMIVMAHGSTEEINQAKRILHAINPSRLDVHSGEGAKGLVAATQGRQLVKA